MEGKREGRRKGGREEGVGKLIMKMFPILHSFLYLYLGFQLITDARLSQSRSAKSGLDLPSFPIVS